MSKALVQILKNSFLPAALMIVSKVVGLYLASKYYNIPIHLDNELAGIFSVQLLVDSSSGLLKLNSFSNLVMLLSLFVGNAYLFIKYSLYLKVQQNPRTVAKLSRMNLLKWITDKNTAFPILFVWVTFLLSACAVIISSSIKMETYATLGYIASAVSVFFMWSLFRLFQEELETVYPKDRNTLY